MGSANWRTPSPASIYTVGVKRATDAPFLIATGFEQARSVVAAIDGNLRAADCVELELQETGVCSLGPADPSTGTNSCCGSDPPPWARRSLHKQ